MSDMYDAEETIGDYILDHSKACEFCKCYPDKQPMGCNCECHKVQS